MGRTDRTRQDLIELLANELGPSLATGRVLMSHVDGCLVKVGADLSARPRALQALGEAGIDVVDDRPAAAAEPEPGSRSSSRADVEPAQPPVPYPRFRPAREPVSAGRERLRRDRRARPHRLSKVLLTAEEEVGLTLLARPDGAPLDKGGFGGLTGEAREAAEAMVLHNMGLVHSVAQRLTGQGMEYDDLVASGVPGLVRAVEMFDPHRGLKFSTYAMNWVRQSISRAVDDEARLIRLPVHVCESVRRLHSAQERLTVNGRKPRWEELARECDMTVQKVEELMRLVPTVVHLETPVGNDGACLGDLLDLQTSVPEHVEVRGLFPEDLEELLAGLEDREADVLRRRSGLAPYDDKATLDDIGGSTG